MAFRARSRMLENTGKGLDNMHEIVEYCDKGGALLKESLAFSSLYPQSDLLKVSVLGYGILKLETAKLNMVLEALTRS